MSLCIVGGKMKVDRGRGTYYQLHKMVMIPGYELASNTPIMNLKAYIILTSFAAAIKAVQSTNHLALLISDVQATLSLELIARTHRS
jgi:hypothetical protein